MTLSANAKLSLRSCSCYCFLLFLVGMCGFVIVGLIGAYKYKHRGDMKTSVFLMQLRVAAQGTAVGFLTLGLAYNMFNEYFLKKPAKKD